MAFSPTVKAALAATLAVTALTACGNPSPSGMGTMLALEADTASTGQIYSRSGQAQLVIKRRPGALGAFNAASFGLETVHEISGLGVQVANVPTAKLNATLSQLRRDSSILYAEPARQVKAFDLPSEQPAGGQAEDALQAESIRVNDPLFGQQYAPQITRAPEAWARSTGRGIKVAIVDTGIDPGHPDLRGNLIPGYNSLTRNANTRDDNGHGTHCAGVTAAQAGNGEGITGIAPHAKLMPIKVLAADGGGSDASVAEGIAWAVERGADVVSLSLGGPSESKVMRDAVAYALTKGVVVVAAMGNDGTNDRSFPAAYPGVIAVGASDARDAIADFSQWGNWISVAAPGVKIMSTLPTYKVDANDYGYPMRYGAMDGTSMATPAVAGLSALLLSVHKTATPAQVKARIEQTADRVGTQRGFNPYFGHGRINVAAALR
ncbi:Thermophilic serine proteinase precursor [compost metagenome]